MRAIEATNGGRAVFLLLASLFVAGACGDKKPDEQAAQPAASQPSPDEQKETVPQPPAPSVRVQPDKPRPDETAKPAAEQPKSPASKETSPEPAQKKPAPPTPPSATTKPAAPASRPTPAEEPKTATPPATAKPAETAQKPVETAQKPALPAKAAAKDVMVLAGAPLGAVRLTHKQHVEHAGGTCTLCHHPSKPQKPATAPQQACSDCHKKMATPPMKTKYQGAFHNPTGQAGTCIDCHKAENAKGKKAPMKCTECHKKDNG